MICCYQVTNIFCTRYGSAIASSARGPCDFGPLTDLAFSVFREVNINTDQNPYFSQAKAKDGSWEELAFESLCSGISSSTKFSLNSCSHSRGFRPCATCVGKQQVSPFYRGLLFICFWCFLVGLATLPVIGFTANNGLPRSIINIET